MMLRRVLLITLLYCFLTVSTISLVQTSEITAGTKEAAASGQPLTCFIIRTYWGHGDLYGQKALRRLLASLQHQTVTRWEALLLVLDSRPFSELRRIVRELGDDRIWVYAEWVSYKYSPKDKEVWATGYHNKLYNLTDEAVRGCPPDSEWVVITNGDNEYDPHFLEAVQGAGAGAAPEEVDIVAVDFYSRYQRPTAAPCERFAAGEGLPACKENGMSFCQTDLAANAYRWRKLVGEDRRFGPLDPQGASSANDGLMASKLREAGWKVQRLPRCLVHHSPTPQQCAAEGGVWDDSVFTQQDHFGGRCLGAGAARTRVEEERGRLEEVEVDVSYDPHSFSYTPQDQLRLKCLRVRDPGAWNQAHVFGRVCAAQVDVDKLPADLPPHPWDAHVSHASRMTHRHHAQ